jgi:hypothetical protein
VGFRSQSKPPGAANGIDVDEQGIGTIITDRQFEIEFLDPGVAAFAFTFG